MTDSTIHLRVPASLKGRWIRASRAAGMRLTDWIIEAVEGHMKQQITTIAIPEGVEFSQLRLQRDPDGAVSLDWAVIERICAASGLDVALFKDGPEDNLAGLLTRWYAAHRAAGGAADPVAEELLAEVLAEDAAGQPFSLPPGRA